jgi:hypothetical protein
MEALNTPCVKNYVIKVITATSTTTCISNATNAAKLLV